MVEIARQAPDPFVQGFAEELPVETDIVIPLALLGELTAHEEKLFAGMGPHKSEIGAKIREALPTVARHLTDQRSLAVHDLVVAERKDKVLVKCIKQPEA